MGLATGIMATLLPLVLIEYGVLHATGGQFIYPVDDTFIHMEVAKNLAQNGTWGLNSHEFGSASSSLLYTLLLALFTKIFSPSMILPFVVNAIAGLLLIFAVNKWLMRQQLGILSHMLIMLAMVFFTPLPMMIMSGMEHTLQCLFSFLFLFGAADWIAELKNKNEGSRLPWQLPVYALLVTASRYEGLFLVAVVCLVLIWHRRLIPAIAIGLAAWLPLLIFGLYALSKGSYFFPNSVLIKSNEVPLFEGGPMHFLEAVLVEKLTLMKPGITALATQRLLLLLPVSFLLFPNMLRRHALVLLMLTACTLLHLVFASTGKFYRYEAYLVLCSAVIVGTVLAQHARSIFGWRPLIRPVMATVLFFFLALPLILRSSAGFSKAKQSCINIYEQQFQMGRFLALYYPDETVAANDIGAVSFFTRGHTVDLWGLGSIDIARSRREHYWSPAFLDSFCKQKSTRLALIYDSWFNNGLEKYWTKVATWTIRNNVVCGDDTVSFYAVDPAYAADLKKNLQAYRLPSTVTVSYY